MTDSLRGAYDFPLGGLATDSGTRGRVFRAIPEGSRVLDVGCDTGRFGELLRREKRCHVAGVERDPAAAAEAAGRLDSVTVRAADSETALEGFSDFDVVLFLDVLEHLYDPWSVLKGAVRTLRPGGLLMAVVPNVAHVSVVRRLLAGTFEYQQHGTMDRTHIRWFTRNSLTAALQNAGLTSVRIDGLPVVPWIQGVRRIGPPVADRLARWMPNLFSGSMLAIGSRPGG